MKTDKTTDMTSPSLTQWLNKASGNSSGDPSGNASGNLFSQLSGPASAQVSARVSGQVSDQLSSRTSDQIPDQISGRIFGEPPHGSPLVQANEITVYFNDTVVFKKFSASVWAKRHLALIGPNGSGKSTLLKLFAGETRLSQIPLEGLENNGTILWNFDDSVHNRNNGDASALEAKKHVRLVSPAQQNTYVRQGWRLSGEEVIASGFHNTPLLYSPITSEEQAHVHKLAEQGGILHLLPMLAPDMSQGQLRALLILRAIVARPKLLLLDEPLEGLDAASRKVLMTIMRLATEQGCTLLLTAHRPDDIPHWIEDLYTLDQQDFQPILAFSQAHEKMGIESQNSRVNKLFGKLSTKFFDQIFPQPAPQVFSHSTAPRPSSHEQMQSVQVAPLQTESIRNPKSQAACTQQEAISPQPPHISLEHVDVYIERTKVLHDISWRINSGEHWLVLGENGSGKSTLLRLLHGEEFAAWGGTLCWFGQPKTALTELQKRVGYVSDRLHSLYTYNMTAHDVVLSGADGSIGIYRELTPQEHERASLLMEYFEITPFATTPFHSLSSGQGRRVLLARALVGAPQVLLLDEPFSGLDAPNRALWLHTLPLLAKRGVSIIFVSHHQGEYGDFFTHRLTLANGRIIQQEPREEAAARKEVS